MLHCGATIKYHLDWSRIPELCQDCVAKEKANRREKPCPGFEGSCPYGNVIRWDVRKHPNGFDLCPQCNNRRKASKDWLIQSENKHATVKVSGDYKRGRTDLLVYDKKLDNKHKHFSINDDGLDLDDWHDWKK